MGSCFSTNYDREIDLLMRIYFLDNSLDAVEKIQLLDAELNTALHWSDGGKTGVYSALIDYFRIKYGIYAMRYADTAELTAITDYNY